MNLRHVGGGVIAGLLTCAMAAFAQTRQTPATSAQASNDRETPIKLVGCLQRESDYRREHSQGRGGAIGTGAGVADEFILVNASIDTGGSAGNAGASNAESCAATAGSGEAYELTGKGEDDLKGMVGHRVAITGMLKPAKLESETVGTSRASTPRPTGGFDPLGQDLKLREVDVTSFSDFSEVASTSSASSQAAPAPVSSAAPEPQSATPATGTRQSPVASETQQPVGTNGTENQLPSTASSLPLTGLIGLLSLAGALVMRMSARGQCRQS